MPGARELNFSRLRNLGHDVDVFDNFYEPFHRLNSGEGCGIFPAPSFSWFGLCLQNALKQRPKSVFVAVPPGVSCQKRVLDRIFSTFHHSLAQFWQLLQLSYWPIKWLYLSWHSLQYIRWKSSPLPIISFSQPRHFRTLRSTIIYSPHNAILFA